MLVLQFTLVNSTVTPATGTCIQATTQFQSSTGSLMPSSSRKLRKLVSPSPHNIRGLTGVSLKPRRLPPHTDGRAMEYTVFLPGLGREFRKAAWLRAHRQARPFPRVAPTRY